ncbi:patatin-like phospholipase family protein [Jeongeupia naejangsanensis]|uniref:Patatin-like phospholipase family protein n=1 Tax=Jeongeupia naejangsanensis TaxID=613195 RepID=A0ABS2BJH2_9NEIS|nr:patatin-like phospholipase family protein [Jeongeupia naejangsanensis]MBM3115751.1 patatin-like phospholipase family protein [Jeongeupia naejangsanensis]
MNALTLYAGAEALARIRRDGFDPELFSHVGAAAGGPKWLVLSRLDRAVFGEWQAQRRTPLIAVGASIGAWRLACLAQRDPFAALARFETAYLGQRYSERPDLAEVTAEARRLLDVLLGDTGADEIAANPRMALNVVVAQRVHGRDGGWSEKAALARMVFANALSRPALGKHLHRHILHTGLPVRYRDDGIPTGHAPLAAGDVAATLMATAAIPGVIAPVHDLPGLPVGAFYDGGLIDYHMDLPLAEPQGLMLLPHFSGRVVTGWLDQFLPWRKPQHLDRTLLLVPSQDWIARLPGGRIPSRADFKRFHGRDAERIQAWQTALSAGDWLADEFRGLVESGRIIDAIRPLPR